MGQSISRSRPTQTSSPESATRHNSESTTQTNANGRPISNDVPSGRDSSRPRLPSSTPSTSTDAGKRSRRQSMRDQLRALRPSPRPTSVASSSQVKGDASFFKKRWRSSKRWSKTPGTQHELIEPPDELEYGGADGTIGQDEGTRAEVPEAETSSGALLHDSRPSTPFPVSGPSTPQTNTVAEAGPEVLSDEEQLASQNIGAWLGGSASSVNPEDTASIHREVLGFLNDTRQPVTPNQDPREPEAHIEPAPSSDTQPIPPRPAHFQAPSTLVVVQGVVNAQDPPPHLPVPSQVRHSGSRSSLPHRSSSTPVSGSRSNIATEERSRSRNRLSSFIRPASMLGRSGTDETATDSASPDGPFPDSTPTAESSTTTTPHVGTQTTTEGRATAESRSSRGLSAGSIDVLGTLLSVAATATAASLFNPPTSTLLSTNAAQPPTSSPSAASRPLSPTPTSGLGTFNPLGGLGLTPPSQNISSTADGRDRMRQAWDSLREMVGLNSRNNPESAVSSTETLANPGQRSRTGDAMLADMARLLNAGLGLPPPHTRASDGASTTNINIPNPTSSQTSDSAHPPPAEGSFERFLLNLQTDLRNILTEEIGSGESSVGGSTDNVSSTEPSTTDSSGSPVHSRSGTDDTSDSQAGTTSHEGPSSGQISQPIPLAPALDEVIDSDVTAEGNGHEHIEGNTAEAEEDVAVRPRVPTPIPSMWSSTPAYSETRERVARAQRTGFADVPSRARPPQPSSQAENGPNRDERDRPFINLWRLYRFPPIPATQAQENVSRTSRVPVATPPSAGTSEPATASSTPATGLSRTATDEGNAIPDSLASTTNPEVPASEAATEAPAFVVPVIVVGLQSVETRGQEDDDDGVPWNPPRDPPVDSMSRAPESPTPWASQSTTPSGASTGRSWGSRAASALRGLRPGARRTRASRLGDGTGSRTFLIYVIGGYYPPGHHMVTGSDQLDSYDALWELAELLGQAKPPTTTQEDIEKSGLEVIKASQLAEYETSGQISSNCTDRCLICLEDYEAEEDLRILSCRHGFHKHCVDKWMQVGRNNCPACRTKGVADDRSPPSSPNVPSVPSQP